jgi:hypothetical protein
MPRIVPSDVVRVLDSIFSWAKVPASVGQAPPQLDYHHLAPVAAIVELLDRVPDELLVLPPDEFAALVAGHAALRAAIRAWQSSDHRFYIAGIAGYEGQSPVHLLRRTLALCPDDWPTAATTALAFVQDAELRESIRLDISAATQD